MADYSTERTPCNRRILVRQRSWTFVPDEFQGKRYVKVKILEAEESNPAFDVPKKATLQKQLTWPHSCEWDSEDVPLEKNPLPLRHSPSREKTKALMSDMQNKENGSYSSEAKALTPYLKERTNRCARHCSVSKNYKYPSFHQHCRKESSSQSPCRKRLKLNPEGNPPSKWYFKFLFYCFISVLTFLLCYSSECHRLIMDHLIQFSYQNNYFENVCNVNMESLKHSLSFKVIGQDSSTKVIIEALESYAKLEPTAELKNCSSNFNNEVSVACPLVLSLHGGVGVGKTFISSIIMNHFCPYCVNFFIIPFHFPEHDFQSNRAYFDFIVDLLTTSQNACSLKLVVFEDIDEAPPGVVSGLENVLSMWNNKQPKTIIILTSSVGEATIKNFTELWIRNNVTRKDFQLQQIESAIISSLHSNQLALQKPWQKALVNNLKAQIIPLLPLEKQHVIRCIISALQLQKVRVTDELIEKILEYQVFIPSEAPVFSKIGCNSVNSRINLIVNYPPQES